MYGTTGGGGANLSCGSGYLGPGCGTIFKITPGGTLTTLYSFCSKSGCADGLFPGQSLVQAFNGRLYGTTAFGGSLTTSCGFMIAGCGTVFEVTPTGTLTTLYTFCPQPGCADGDLPLGLIQGASGDLYGLTYSGGSLNNGTVFKISPSGALTTLHLFCLQGGMCTDGSAPEGTLIQASDGDFYGTTINGGTGADYGGTVFKITFEGALTTVYNFCSQLNCMDGYLPYAGLVQDTNGSLYGTTVGGGPNMTCTTNVYGPGCGEVFSLAVDLGPFVEPQTTSGTVGEGVTILGTNLTGATSVSFAGIAAAFRLVSSSEIVTRIPVGATSGKIHVVTPGATLSSNAPFRVLP